MMDKAYTNVVKRLVRRTRKVGDCFIWVGAKDNHGYGHMGYGFKIVRVHRLAAHLFRGLDLDEEVDVLHKNHVCTSKSCWNPAHTYEGTQKDNSRDCVEMGNQNTWTKNSRRRRDGIRKTS